MERQLGARDVHRECREAMAVLRARPGRVWGMGEVLGLPVERDVLVRVVEDGCFVYPSVGLELLVEAREPSW